MCDRVYTFAQTQCYCAHLVVRPLLSDLLKPLLDPRERQRVCHAVDEEERVRGSDGQPK